MKDGLTADDIWVMVEDEFNSTAAMFTRHIHEAEYKRLKQRAKSHNAAAIKDIEWPSDSRYPLSNESKVQRKSAALSATQQKTLEPYADSEDSDDGPWSQNPVLAEMMSQPKEVSSRLASVAGVKSSTRAALGYAKAKSHSSQLDTAKTVAPTKNEAITRKPDRQTNRPLPRTDDDEDDDLDEVSYPATSKRRNEQIKAPMMNRNTLKVTKKRPPDLKKENRLYHSSHGTAAKTPQRDMSPPTSKNLATSDSSTSIQARPSIPDTFDDFPLRRVAPSSYSERMAKRKAEAAKKEQDSKRKSVSFDQIPTFLI